MEYKYYTIGVMEYHDWFYWKHDNENPFKYSFPKAIQKIKDIPNRTPYTTSK